MTSLHEPYGSLLFDLVNNKLLKCFFHAAFNISGSAIICEILRLTSGHFRQHSASSTSFPCTSSHSMTQDLLQTAMQSDIATTVIGEQAFREGCVLIFKITKVIVCTTRNFQ